ncbi:hypothetical protein psal_cds_292 [Pandoravirus salinus]|uniref:Uncharacterized protein n=1 Tax=Pandoravirus salinus TaxID=1349410 RepID=S4W184_9VIRU|nr:hypothetical protein psal_cds_292 [Pandoravirus salinus]AGO83885.1 hypothetical protein psal_cds_292 [Pandoravirus salinus]
MSEGRPEAVPDDAPTDAVEARTPTDATGAVVVIADARYCRATGCVMVPLTIDGTVVRANWVMSSPNNIIGPAASKRIRGVHVSSADGSTAPTAQASSGACDGDTPADASPDDATVGVGRANVRRAWPTVCHAVGAPYRPHTLGAGGVIVRPRQGQLDAGIEFLCADRVRLSTLSGAQLAHRAAQAHTSIVSVARPTPDNGAHSLLARLVGDGAAARPSVLWDMRAVPRGITVAVGLSAPVSDPNAALVRLYTPDHPEVLAAGDERIVGLARTGALARLLGIEVAVSPESPTLRLALDGPEWAVIDVGVRACYFDQEIRATVVDALARAGPAPWRACPLWARGTVLASEAAGVLGVPAAEAPVLALVLAGYDPMRPVRLRLTREAYVHTSPPHQVRFRWSDPRDRVDGVADGGNVNGHRKGVDGAADGDHDRAGNEDNGVALDVQYTQVDLAAWMSRGPGGACLIGNCAFDGRAVLVDYEANAMAVFAADAHANDNNNNNN